MTQPSQLLVALLAALRPAAPGGPLVLGDQTLAGTGASTLLDLFTQRLRVSSVTLDGARLPAAVDGDTLTIRGALAGAGDVAAQLTFTAIRGEVGTAVLFQASSAAALQKAFPALPADFFRAITAAGAAAQVSVPGKKDPLILDAPRYGVAGLVTPMSGFALTSIAPRVDGNVLAGGKSRGLLVQVPGEAGGYRIAPLGGGWAFTDLDMLLPGISVVGALPGIITGQDGKKALDLRGFELRVYPDTPGLSSVSVDIADPADPSLPLWTAAGGKVALTDVTVTLSLSYSGGTLVPAGSGSVRGDFRLRSLALSVQIPFPLTGMWALTAYPNISLDVLDDIAELLPAGSSAKDLLPPGLASLGKQFELSYLNIIVSAGAGFALSEFTIAIQTPAKWPLVPGVIELEALRLVLTVNGKGELTGTVTGTMRFGKDSDIIVSFGRNTPQEPWRLDVISPAVALPSLDDLAQLAPHENLGSLVRVGGLDDLHFVMTNLNLGLTLPPPKLTNLGLTLQLADGGDPDFPLKPKLGWEIIKGALTLTQFSFGFQVNWGATVTKTAFGTFVLNGLEFDVRFAAETATGASMTGLIGEYSAGPDAGRPVNVRDLMHSIAPAVAAELPDGLDIELADAVLAYVKGSDGKQKFLFAMDIGIEMPISDLPLVGKALPAGAMVGIKNLKVVVASAALTAPEVAFINGMSAKPVLPAGGGSAAGGPASASGDATVIPAGFSMVAELQLGSLTLLLTSPPVRRADPKPAPRAGGAPVPALPAGPVTPAAPAGPPAPPAAPADPVMWVPVQKAFGPVQIQKVGFSYRGGKLYVVSNLALAAGGLEIDLLSIGVDSPITTPAIEFTIQGLAVSFAEGPVSIMGGMIGTLQPDLDFTGVLSVHAPELALTAFAGYAEYHGHPSFFLYGVLDAPIGGPPAFFVTGIAAGVGFNRKLVIPDVSGVATFPLVAWAQGNGAPPMDPALPLAGQVGQALALLAESGVVAPSVGEYWLAAGVRFTSFELVSTFALLTVSLGPHVEIALLGLSTLTMPPDDPKPVAQVQLAIEVAFSPDKGLLAIAGQLTSNSYVLAPECRLTGGFAFYLWFGPEHTGEIVLTLGGYNPNFTVPDYYPAVPRVGMNWKLSGPEDSGELKISGELYFALTTNVVMAGGKLSAVWSSGPVSAWFTYWADFLMTFAPFHYYVDGGIDLGASFTVDLAFVSVSGTIHVGVNLELWGPPFAGRARVNLSVISFTILINDHQPDTATAVPWRQFVAQLLPAQPAMPAPRPLGERAGDPAPAAAVQVNVASGLVRELAPNADGPVYLVTAETFQCTVLTVIPSKAVTFQPDPADPDKDHQKFENLSLAPDSEQPQGPDKKAITPATSFGAGPAGLAPADFQPKLTLALRSDTTSVLHAYRRLGNAPKALWEHKSFDPARGVPQVDPATALTDATIPDALTGLTLIPYLDRADWTRPVPEESLLSSRGGRLPFGWSPGLPPEGDPFTGETVAGSIAAPAVAGVRSALLGALAAQGVAVSTTVDVSRLAGPATTGLQAAPRLRLLGEARNSGEAGNTTTAHAQEGTA